MKKNKILLLSIAVLFLNGCSCSYSKKSYIVTKNNPKDNTQINNPEDTTKIVNPVTPNNPGGSINDGGNTHKEDDNNEENITYIKEGSVYIEGRVEYFELLPTPVVVAPNYVVLGSEKYFYTSIENKEVPVDLNSLSIWKTYDPWYDRKMLTGDYVLIAYYENGNGEHCYTDTFEYTVYKGNLDPEIFAITNHEHNHVLPIADNIERLADVEQVLNGYCLYYLDEGYYEASFEGEGVVKFEDDTILLEPGTHTYTLIYIDDSDCYNPFKCDVTFNVTSEVVKSSEVKLALSQLSFKTEGSYGQGALEATYNGFPYKVSIEDSEHSDLFEINFAESTSRNNSFVSGGKYIVAVSIKSPNVLSWLHDDGTTFYGNLEFEISIKKKEIDFEFYTYFSLNEYYANVSERVSDGGSVSLYMGETGKFFLYKCSSNENKLGEEEFDCSVNIVSNDGCIKLVDSNPSSILGLKSGNAVVDVVYPGNSNYSEKIVTRIEVQVLSHY